MVRPGSEIGPFESTLRQEDALMVAYLQVSAFSPANARRLNPSESSPLTVPP